MQSEKVSEDGEIETLAMNFFYMLRRHWRLELGLCAIACLVAIIITLLLPKEFEATASVLPPMDPRAGRGVEALLGQVGASSTLGALAQGSANKDDYLGILKSRRMQDDIIRKFDLIKGYRLEGSRAPMRDARAKLGGMTNIRTSREGIISVTVTAYDPKTAADIANFYVRNLDRMNTSINVTEAGRTRLFLEGRVAEAQEALRGAEDRLRAFQSESKAVVMEGQTKSAIEGMARLEGEILAAEVQLKTLEMYSTARNPDVIKLKESIEEMRRQLKRMGYGPSSTAPKGARQKGSPAAAAGIGVGANAGGPGTDFALPLGSIPATGIELGRLIREVKLQETISTLLSQQLEQAKIAEAKDTPTVRILDDAVPPEWKSRPSLLKNTVFAGIVSFFFAVVLVLLLEGLKQTKMGRGEIG